MARAAAEACIAIKLRIENVAWPPSVLPPSCLAQCAGEIEELRRREREQGIEPDWEVEAFMKASVRAGKRNNIRTDYTLRLLGLEVAPE